VENDELLGSQFGESIGLAVRAGKLNLIDGLVLCAEFLDQIEAKALRKLRHPSRSHRLRRFWKPRCGIRPPNAAS
jgi:hypothetical protein